MDGELRRESPLDDDGFLYESGNWSQAVARDLAERNDLGPLTDEHWRIIDFVRTFYAEYRQGPPIVKIAKATGMTSKRICTLFPCGIAKGAYRLAGLPRPDGCL
jgi:TusE/DsrC/DsvC family sulfur relay protein